MFSDEIQEKIKTLSELVKALDFDTQKSLRMAMLQSLDNISTVKGRLIKPGDV